MRAPGYRWRSAGLTGRWRDSQEKEKLPPIGCKVNQMLLFYFFSFHLATFFVMLPPYRLWFVQAAYGRTNIQQLSSIEQHLFGATGGFHASMGVACGWSFFVDTSANLIRLVLLMEVILWFCDWYDSLALPDMDSTLMAVNATAATVGFLAHIMWCVPVSKKPAKRI